MKRLMSVLVLSVLTFALWGQKMDTLPKCEGEGYKKYVARYDANGKKVCDCYNGTKVNLANVEGVQKLQQSKATGIGNLNQKGGESMEKEFGTYQPILFGYHLAYMDPLDPQTNGTKPRNSATPLYIFNDVNQSVLNAKDLFYYMGGAGGNNSPKFLDYNGHNTETYSEYITNSVAEMTKAFEHNMGGSLGYGGFEVGGNSGGSKRFAVSNNKVVGIHINNTTNGKYQLTSFATFSQEFLDALNQLQKGPKRDSDFEAFMLEWGSHYASSVVLGSSKYHMSEFTAEEVSKGESNNWGVNIGAKGSSKGAKTDGKDITKAVAGYSASGDYSKSNEKSTKAGKSIGKEKYIATGNDNDKTSPIKVNLIPIYELCKALEDSKFNTDLYTKFKTSHEKFFKSLDKGDKYKPFISQEELDKLKNPTGANAKFEDGNFDAVCYNPNTEKYYFFRGENLWERVSGGQPVWKNYATEFPQMDQALKGKYFDAAVFSSVNNTYYFFRGNKYWRKKQGQHDVERGSEGEGFPLSNWGKGKLSIDTIDYVVWKETNRITPSVYGISTGDTDIVSGVYYFFSGSDYWEIPVDGNNEKEAKGPYKIKDEWSGGSRIDDEGERCSAGVFKGDTYYFFRNDESLSKPKGRGINTPVKIKGDWIY